MVQNRSIGVCILLSIVTCGIYSIYWFIKLTDETNIVAEEPNGTSGGIAFLLSLVTCGIYGFYWAYKQGEKLDNAYTKRGLVPGSKGVLYIVLCVVGLSIVAFALMQDSLNKLSAPQQ